MSKSTEEVIKSVKTTLLKLEGNIFGDERNVLTKEDWKDIHRMYTRFEGLYKEKIERPPTYDEILKGYSTEAIPYYQNNRQKLYKYLGKYYRVTSGNSIWDDPEVEEVFPKSTTTVTYESKK